MEPEPKSEKFDIRIAPSMRRALNAIHRRRGTKDSIIGLELLRAFIAAETEENGVALPMSVVMASEHDQQMVAEDKTEIAKKEKPPDKRDRSRGAGPDADVRKPA